MNVGPKPTEKSSFEQEAKLAQTGIVAEFVDFLIHNKKWWLTPILLVLFTMSLFIVLTNTAIGPFIYILF